MNSRTSLLSLLLLSLFSALTACEGTDGATQVIVVVRSDSEAVASELTTIQARVFAATATSDTEAHSQQTFQLTKTSTREDEGVSLPFSFAVKRAKADRFLLVLEGYGSQLEEPLIEHRVTVGFRRGHTLFVEVVLGGSCLRRVSLCTGFDQTCHPVSTAGTSAGECGPVPEAMPRPLTEGAELDGDPSDEPGELDADTPAEPDASDGDAPSEDGDGGMSSGAMDAASDAPPSTDLDANAVENEAAVDATPDSAVRATVGASCQDANAKACDVNDTRQRLICLNGQWALNGSCDGDTRCQSRSDSPELGACQPVVAACVGKQPGDAVCDGTTRRTCGPDLLEYLPNPCPAHASCREQAGAVSCACDTPYMSDGKGGCTVPICMQMPCQNGGICSLSGTGRSCDCSAIDFSGPSCETRIDDCATSPCAHGRCIDGVRSRTCDCTNTGYEGPTCATDINECARAGASACSGTRENGFMFTLECAETQAPGYYCQGQYAEWPMPDSTPGAKFSPNYDTSTAGTVRDLVTGLFWQRETPSTYQGCTGHIASPRDSCILPHARVYCDALTLGGRSDWRLPSKIELESIFDVTRREPAAHSAFGFRPGSWRYVVDGRMAELEWYADFSVGTVEFDMMPERPRLVRCVASGAPTPGTPDTRYVVNESNGTVTDTRTTLIWQRTERRINPWMQAPATVCSAPWRAPTFKELLTLVDLTRFGHAIHPAFRGETASDEATEVYVYSSPTYPDGSYRTVQFTMGTSGSSENPVFVRCVR